MEEEDGEIAIDGFDDLPEIDNFQMMAQHFGQANKNIGPKFLQYPPKKTPQEESNVASLSKLCQYSILKTFIKFCVSEIIHWKDKRWLQYKEHFQSLPQHLRDEIFKAIFHNQYSNKIRSLVDLDDIFPDPVRMRRKFPIDVLAAIRQLSGKDLFTAWWFFMEDGKTTKLGFKSAHDLKFSDALMTFINAGNKVNFVELEFTYNWFLSNEFISMIKKLDSLKKLTVHSTQHTKKVLKDLMDTGHKFESFTLSFPDMYDTPTFVEHSIMSKKSDSKEFALDFLEMQADTIREVDLRGWLGRHDSINDMLKILNTMPNLKHLTVSGKDMKNADLELYPNIANLDHFEIGQSLMVSWVVHFEQDAM